MSTYRNVDGSMVTIDAPGYDLSHPWQATFEVRFGGRSTDMGELIDELDIFPAGNHEPIVERVLNGQVADRVTHKGGTLVAAHGVSQGLIVWVGERFEISAFTRSPTPTLADAIRRFGLLDITEHVDGIEIHSNDNGHVVVPYSARKIVPDVGFVIIRRPQDALKLMPSWQGMTVEAGELWRIDGAAPVDDQLLLGSDTCAAVLSPTAETTNQDLITFSAAIRTIEWSN